ncbi:MAG: hypothetical protein QMC80_07915, partial [Thermoplasmatales archaeon]|nr:hypothetical protein [Thermoplasmatales archaeon]
MKGVNNGWDEVTKFVEDAKRKGGRNMLNKKILIGVVIAVVAVLVGASLFVVLQAPEKAPAGAVYGVEMTCSENSKTAAPGDIATYTITVENTGNTKDTVTVSKSGPTVLNWVAELSAVSVELNAGESKTVTLIVTAPIVAVEPAVVTVTGTSQGDSSKSDSVTTTTTLSPTFGVNVTSDDRFHFVSQLIPTLYDVVVKNTGDVQETINVNITRDKIWDVSGSYNGSPEIHDIPAFSPGEFTTFDVTLGPGEFSAIEIRVIAPADATCNDKAVVTVTGTISPGEYSPGEYGPGEFGPGEFVTLETTVRKITSVYVTAEKMGMDGIHVYAYDSNDQQAVGANVYVDNKKKGTTDENGELDITGLRSGWMDVKVVYKGCAAEKSVAVGEVLFIEAIQVGGIKGASGYSYQIYVSNSTGVAVSGASVYINNKLYGSTDANGLLSITLRDGKYKIEAIKKGSVTYGNATADVGTVIYAEAFVFANDADGEKNDVVINVTNSTGGPVAGASVYIDNAYVDTTDDNGQVYDYDLQHKEHQVDVYYGNATAKTKFHIGDYILVYAHLYALDTDGYYNDVTVEVYDDKGNWVNGAKVYIDDAYKGKTKDNGTYTENNLSAGTHVINITHGNKFASTTIYIEGDVVNELFVKAYVIDEYISGSIVFGNVTVWVWDANWTPIENATVYIDSYAQGETGADGTLTRYGFETGIHFVDVYYGGLHAYIEFVIGEVCYPYAYATALNGDGIYNDAVIYIYGADWYLVSWAKVYIDGNYLGNTTTGVFYAYNFTDGWHTVDVYNNIYGSTSFYVGTEYIYAYAYSGDFDYDGASDDVIVYVYDQNWHLVSGADVYIDSIYKGNTAEHVDEYGTSYAYLE